jgi:hypothetical protein
LEKKINGPPPQPSLPAVHHAIINIQGMSVFERESACRIAGL